MFPMKQLTVRKAYNRVITPCMLFWGFLFCFFAMLVIYSQPVSPLLDPSCILYFVWVVCLLVYVASIRRYLPRSKGDRFPLKTVADCIGVREELPRIESIDS